MAATVRLNAIISIHALLAEGDGDVKLIVDLENISIHALLAEGDKLLSSRISAVQVFLSTPSLRRATTWDCISPSGATFLSTPSLRRATQSHPRGRHCIDISIHALLAEGDTSCLF